MPLSEDLLEPIAGENPAGINMRYERVYDQIKEARTEDDDTLPAGAWERQAKKADFNLVVKLCNEVLLNKSKDLQVASWLGEAYIKREGAGQVAPVLTFLLDLQKKFWDTIHPEIDEGDVGLRAVPLQWAANRYATLVYEFPITKNGFTYFSYKSGKALGYAADAANNEAKTKARNLAISRNQPTAEEIDDAIAGSPKSFYANLDPLLQVSREILEELSLYCEEQYQDDGPSFRKLRDSLDEVHNLVHSLLVDKLKTNPDPVVVEAEPEPEVQPVPVATPVVVAAPAAAAPVFVPAPVPVPTSVVQPVRAQASSGGAGSPASWDEATERVHACAAYMHGERPGSSVPYLLHSSIRWGELRKGGVKPALDLLTPPPTEIRSGLKLAAAEKNWSVVLATGMNAMGEPCARCWLDLHRYLWNAVTNSGYAAFGSMILLAVRGILHDYPDMSTWTFSDDTPVANTETIEWLQTQVLLPAGAEGGTALATASTPQAPSPSRATPPLAPLVISAGSGKGEDEITGEAKSDVFTEAAALANGGDLSGAVAMLIRNAAQQSSGRGRFRRRVQIAELCLASGSASVAVPILRELVAETETRGLETWEPGEVVARPIELLLRGLNESRTETEWTEQFTRLCRLNPAAALEINR